MVVPFINYITPRFDAKCRHLLRQSRGTTYQRKGGRPSGVGEEKTRLPHSMSDTLPMHARGTRPYRRGSFRRSRGIEVQREELEYCRV